MKKRKKNKKGDNEHLSDMSDVNTPDAEEVQGVSDEKETKSIADAENMHSTPDVEDVQDVSDTKEMQGTIDILTEPSQTEPESQPDKLSPGAQLAAIREAAGMEQEQVAVSLKMTVRQVRELESDNYESLHGIAIARGFIRAYAKMLQVDPEPFVALVTNNEPATKHLDQIQKMTKSTQYNHGQAFGKKRSASSKMIWLLVVVFWIGAAFVVHNFKWLSSDFKNADSQKQEVANSQDKSENQVVVTEIRTPVAALSDAGEVAGEISDDSGKTGVEEGTELVASSKQDALQGQIVDMASTTAAKSDDVVIAGETEGNVLMIRFNLPTKVHLLRSDSSVLREVTGKEGDVQQMEISEPVTLLVEKAIAVETEFRGQPLVLKSGRRSSSAKIDLK